MRKLLAAGMVIVIGLAGMVACNKQKSYQDGTYTAEFANYDSRGYKDTLYVVVENGQVTSVQFDGVSAEGMLKSNDERLLAEMAAVQGNYPTAVNANLVNQLLAMQNVNRVDVVAGATYSTDSFKALYTALEKNIYKGDETPLVVENIPEK